MKEQIKQLDWLWTATTVVNLITIVVLVKTLVLIWQ